MQTLIQFFKQPFPYFQKKWQISQKTLRATLLQMEELLSDYPFLVRCHRNFDFQNLQNQD